MESLTNRGVPLFSSVTYLPTLSTLSNGAYATWALYPISTLFYDLLYGFENFDQLYTEIGTISTKNIAVSTTLDKMDRDVANVSTSTADTLTTFSNLPISTVSSLQASSRFYLQSAVSNVINLSNFSTLDEPGLSYWLSIDPPNFISTNFNPNSNTMVGVAQSKYGYIPLPSDINFLTTAVALDEVYPLFSGVTNSTLFTTLTGTSWSEVANPPPMARITAFEKTDNFYLAAGISTNTAAFPSPLEIVFSKSEDGKTWSTYTATTNALPPFPIPKSLAWNGSVWVMGTTSGILNSNILFSYDAIYWSTISYNNPPLGGPPTKLQSCESVAWNGTTFCAVGQPATIGTGAINISPDGFQWYGTNTENSMNFSLGYKAHPYEGGWMVGGEANTGIGPTSGILIHMSSYTNYYTEWYPLLRNGAPPSLPIKVTAVETNSSNLLIGVECAPFNNASLLYASSIKEDIDYFPIDCNDAWFSNVNDIHYTGYQWFAGGFPGDLDRKNSFAYSLNGRDWIPNGTSTFSTAVYKFVSINENDFVNSTGPDRVQFGVSAIISTLIYEPISTNVNVTYPAILSNTSTTWGEYATASVSSIDALGSSITFALPNIFESGSTLNILLISTNIQLQSSFNNYFFGSTISTYSTTFYSHFNDFVVPELSSSVTTFSNLTQIQQVIFIDQMYTTFSNNGASNSIVNFSNMASTQFVAACNAFAPYNNQPGLESMIQQNNSVLIPFLNIISLSTNVIGFQRLSTFAVSSLSSFSSLFPFILASSLFYDLSNLNVGISSLSTQGTLQTAAFLTLHDSFITGPQVSSLELFVSSGVSTAFVDYSRILSVPQVTFSNAFQNVNMVPGLCTLSASTLGSFSTIAISSPEVLNFLYVQYPLSSVYATQFLSTTKSQIDSNLSSYTSSIAYYSTLSTTAAVFSTQTEILSDYVSSQNAPGGAFDLRFSSILTIPAKTLEIVNPFLGSTIFFPPFELISSYVLSNFGFGVRSTFFTQIRTSTILGISDATASLLGVQSYADSTFRLSLQGNLNLQDSATPNSNPSIHLPNFHIYANNTFVDIPSTNSLQIYNSSIYFHSTISLRQVFNSIQRGQLSLNMEPQNYALDLGFGDARKPEGSLWISPSDERIKEQIQAPDGPTLENLISRVRLVSFNYTKSYATRYGVADSLQLGFISQEIKQLFSQAVSIDSRDGLVDFESLDMDQILMAKFAVTKRLLGRVSTLKARVQTLL
jgi:hypothetical protein